MNKRKTGAVLLVTALLTLVFVAASPGSAEDPLISRSYIDTVLMPKIEKMNSFEVVSLYAGQRLIGAAGCEMIVRSGSGIIIASEKGGVADTTDGADLPNNGTAPSNHLLIVPLADGRGIYAGSDMLIMVKGKYHIQ